MRDHLILTGLLATVASGAVYEKAWREKREARRFLEDFLAVKRENVAKRAAEYDYTTYPPPTDSYDYYRTSGRPYYPDDVEGSGYEYNTYPPAPSAVEGSGYEYNTYAPYTDDYEYTTHRPYPTYAPPPPAHYSTGYPYYPRQPETTDYMTIGPAYTTGYPNYPYHASSEGPYYKKKRQAGYEYEYSTPGYESDSDGYNDDALAVTSTPESYDYNTYPTAEPTRNYNDYEVPYTSSQSPYDDSEVEGSGDSYPRPTGNPYDEDRIREDLEGSAEYMRKFGGTEGYEPEENTYATSSYDDEYYGTSTQSPYEKSEVEAERPTEGYEHDENTYATSSYDDEYYGTTGRPYYNSEVEAERPTEGYEPEENTYATSSYDEEYYGTSTQSPYYNSEVEAERPTEGYEPEPVPEASTPGYYDYYGRAADPTTGYPEYPDAPQPTEAPEEISWSKKLKLVPSHKLPKHAKISVDVSIDIAKRAAEAKGAIGTENKLEETRH